MNRLFLFPIFLLFLVPPSVFGLADIENKNIIAESRDGQIILSLEFGENKYSKFDRIIPTLQSGLLVVGDSIVEIEDARAKIMGDSFVVHSKNILIYAKGLGNESYLVNSYLLGGNQFDPIKLVSVPSQKKPGFRPSILSIDCARALKLAARSGRSRYSSLRRFCYKFHPEIIQNIL